ncbi:hypothetical protein EDB89DRAFT_2084519 [Lactarius sanguifluus]|nr:hypothetical protein EDB89DRAFT_2084519 [Lactarius sanguifluus]
MSQGTQVAVTPFNLTGSTLIDVAPPKAGPQTDSQQRKELARRRSLANGSRSQPADTRPFNSPLATDGDTLGGAAVVATPSYEARIPSDVNVLRDEVQQLHEEISEPPPSYTSGAA